MLTLTPAAVQMICALTDEYAITSEAGVRLSSDEAGTLIASLVPWPDEGDRVMEVSGARLFVDADVAEAVDDKSLDIAFTHDGEVIFALNDQPYSVAARPTARARWGRHLRSRRGP
jgi:Fe-S cluster assembly iron-binding protein IscA